MWYIHYTFNFDWWKVVLRKACFSRDNQNDIWHSCHNRRTYFFPHQIIFRGSYRFPGESNARVCWNWFIVTMHSERVPRVLLIMRIASCRSRIIVGLHLNTLRPRQDGGHFPDDVFKCIFLYENVWIPITICMAFVPKGPINNIPALVRRQAIIRTNDG